MSAKGWPLLLRSRRRAARVGGPAPTSAISSSTNAVWSLAVVIDCLPQVGCTWWMHMKKKKKPWASRCPDAAVYAGDLTWVGSTEVCCSFEFGAVSLLNLQRPSTRGSPRGGWLDGHLPLPSRKDSLPTAVAVQHMAHAAAGRHPDAATQVEMAAFFQAFSPNGVVDTYTAPL